MCATDDQSREDSPRWAIAYSSFDEDGASIAIRCSRKLFYIEVLVEEVGDWSMKSTFLQLLQDVPDEHEAEESLYDLIWAEFLPVIKPLVALSCENSTSLSLQDFYGVNVASFKLTSSGREARFIQCPESYPLPADLLPHIKLSHIKSSAKVVQTDASRTQIKPWIFEDPDIGSDAPVKVSLDDAPGIFHFKVVQDHSSFLREFEILSQLTEHRLNKKYRFPVLHSLVTYSDKPETVMGILIHHIDHDGCLSHWINTRNPSYSLKQKWYHQIEDMVRALHRHAIVWGDVKPENVLIDRKQNAWVIDFGGGFNSGYVDEEVMETVEGDRQGMSRMREMLLHGKQY